MTMAGQPSAGAAAPGSSMPVMIGVGVVAVLVLLFYVAGGERPLPRSAAGFNGLVAWLKANDIEARVFERGLLVRGEVALRILPLYDTDLASERPQPASREEVIAQTSEVDLDANVLQAKLRSQPTLVVLPKWRTGMRALGVAHRDLLIPEEELNGLLRQIGLGAAQIRRDPEGFTTARERVGERDVEIGLMHEQGVRGTDCAPLIGPRDAPILMHCTGPSTRRGGATEGRGGASQDTTKAGGEAVSGARSRPGTTRPRREFWLLADPDLWSNHGLAHAGNGAALLAFLEGFEKAKPVILDLTVDNLTVDEDWRARHYERSWEDFARMFAWPFTMIWIAFAAVAALVLWRAVTRYGPVARPAADEPRAAKEVSIDAKARLLRLSGHDVALLQSHVKARLAHLAAELFGAHQPPGKAPLDLLTEMVARTRPELARELAAAAEIPPREADPIGRLDRFENCYNRIRHDLGRAKSPR